MLKTYKNLDGRFCSKDKILGYDSIGTPIRAAYKGTVIYDIDFPKHFIAGGLLKENLTVYKGKFWAKTGREAILKIKQLEKEAKVISPWNRASQLEGYKKIIRRVNGV